MPDFCNIIEDTTNFLRSTNQATYCVVEVHQGERRAAQTYQCIFTFFNYLFESAK